MHDKKGFASIEMIQYFIIMLIVLVIFSTIILRNVYYENNERIKIYQSLDILRKSIQKYPNVKYISNKEIAFFDHVRLKITNKQVYETPGFMPYLQNVEQAKFSYDKSNLSLSFSYKKKRYYQIIFYDKG